MSVNSVDTLQPLPSGDNLASAGPTKKNTNNIHMLLFYQVLIIKE